MQVHAVRARIKNWAGAEFMGVSFKPTPHPRARVHLLGGEELRKNEGSAFNLGYFYRVRRLTTIRKNLQHFRQQ